MSQSIEAFINACRDRTNLLLENCVPAQGLEQKLIEAIRYALLGSGKRIRPCLTYAGASLTSGFDSDSKNIPGTNTNLSDATDIGATDRAACAIELMHTYSLVHDDLPAMDDDELRRGKPTCHVAYDEATAILAGDALQTLAFEQLSLINDLSPEQLILLFKQLSQASGPSGMVLGQAMDLHATNNTIDIDYLETMHQRKTADLIAASVTMGALSAGETNQETLISLHDYGMNIGLAFQVRDDILDELGDTQTLGKTAGADATQHKNTYTSLLGLDRSKILLEELLEKSLQALDNFGDQAEHLRSIAHFVVQRAY